MDVGLALFFLVVVAYALISQRLERWLITMPIFFVVAGALLGDFTQEFSVGIAAVETLTEVTLALLLFADAATIGFRSHRSRQRLARPAPLDRAAAQHVDRAASSRWRLFPGEGIWFAFLLAVDPGANRCRPGSGHLQQREGAGVHSPGAQRGKRTQRRHRHPVRDSLPGLTLGRAKGDEPFLRSALLELGLAVVIAIVVGVVGGKLFLLATNASGWSRRLHVNRRHWRWR